MTEACHSGNMEMRNFVQSLVNQMTNLRSYPQNIFAILHAFSSHQVAMRDWAMQTLQHYDNLKPAWKTRMVIDCCKRGDMDGLLCLKSAFPVMFTSQRENADAMEHRLWMAISHQHTHIVSFLLQLGKHNYSSALCHAVRKGQIAFVELFLQLGGRLTANSLFECLQNEESEMTDYILNHSHPHIRSCFRTATKQACEWIHKALQEHANGHLILHTPEFVVFDMEIPSASIKRKPFLLWKRLVSAYVDCGETNDCLQKDYAVCHPEYCHACTSLHKQIHHVVRSFNQMPSSHVTRSMMKTTQTNPKPKKRARD